MESPAPGTYFKNVTTKKIVNNRGRNSDPPQWSFGTSARGKLNQNEKTPGPGAYEAPPCFANVASYEKFANN